MCIIPYHISHIRIMSDIIVVFWLCCVKNWLKTMGLICYTWKKLGSALCGNPTRLKFGRDTRYSGWLRGRILGQRGAGFNKDIPLETQSNRAFTLCQLHFLWEALVLQRSDQCSSSTGAILYVVPVNYIQYERARISLMDLKQSKRKHWYIVQSHTHTHTYMHTENKFNVVTSFKAVNVKRDQWQFKVIEKPRNKNKFGAWHAVGKE